MMKNQRNGVDHDECPLKNGSGHDGRTCSVLSDVLGQRPVELFFQDNITTELNPQGTEFVSNLNFSTCSPTFVHGADMLPGMAAGFSTFLGKLGGSLDAIKKIKFKKVTQGNLHYIITPTENKEKKIKANVLGQFVDNKNTTYYFYGMEKEFDKQPQICQNPIPKCLLMGDPSESGSLKHVQNKKKIKFPLYDQRQNNTGPYIEEMKKNEGYVRSVMLDIINLVCVERFKTPGLVRGYDNLVIHEDTFLPEYLFDGSCTLEADSFGQPIPLRDAGYSYEISFRLIHKNKGEVLSGTASLFSSSLCQ